MLKWTKVKKGSAASWEGVGFGTTRSSGVWAATTETGTVVAVIRNRSENRYMQQSQWEISLPISGPTYTLGAFPTLAAAKEVVENYHVRTGQKLLAIQEIGGGI